MGFWQKFLGYSKKEKTETPPICINLLLGIKFQKWVLGEIKVYGNERIELLAHGLQCKSCTKFQEKVGYRRPM